MTTAYRLDRRVESQEVNATPDDAMQRMGVPIAYAKDEEIYGQGEAADLIYLVTRGTVRTSRFLPDGRRPVDDFYYPGDIFGVETGARHTMSAEALSDAEILVVSRRALVAAAGEQALERLIHQAALRDLESAREHLNLLVRKTASERVASFLERLATRGRGDVIELAMGRQDTADYLGLTIETVSRMISQLQAAKVVEFEGCRQFRVRDAAALSQMAAG